MAETVADWVPMFLFVWLYWKCLWNELNLKDLETAILLRLPKARVCGGFFGLFGVGFVFVCLGVFCV